MTKISIIIPAYNEERYIKRCLNSVVNQNFEDYEVIAINDGSTDNTLNIMKQYESKKLKIIDQLNQGVSFARNKGLNLAQGEFIQFVDSDDYINEDTLKTLYNIARTNDADLVKMSVETRFGLLKLGDFSYFGRKRNSGIVDKNVDSDYVVKCLSSICDKFIKHELLENITFPNKLEWEDLAVVPFLLAKANNLYHLNDKLYNYQLMFNTTVHNTFYKCSRLTDIFKILDILKNNFIENGIYDLYKDEFDKIGILHIILRISDVLTWININKEERLKILYELVNILNIRFPNWQDNIIIHERKDILFQNAVKAAKKYSTEYLKSEVDSLNDIDAILRLKK